MEKAERKVPSKRKKKSGEDYLRLSADILCRAAYELCEGSFGRKSRKDSVPDAKSLKETCSAVKEAMAVASGLSADEGVNENIKVFLSSETEEFSV